MIVIIIAKFSLVGYIIRKYGSILPQNALKRDCNGKCIE